jgi:hypothetical protein
VATTAVITPPAIWTPCRICWGQRRIYENRNGEGLVPCTCTHCLGVGEELGLVD